MNKPLVSVIIPNYNHARFLDERIQSVLDQTYQNFEMIILDDKSTDNSVEIIYKYKDNPHVSHIVVNAEKSGSTFKQWYKGLELATGDLVWIAESADSCDVSMLETLVNGITDNQAVVSFCNSFRYGIYGNIYRFHSQKELSQSIIMEGREFVSKFMIRNNIIINTSSAIFRRNVALSIDKLYMNLQGDDNWLFWIELMEKGNVFYCNEELNFFRFRDEKRKKELIASGILPLNQKIIFDYLVNKKYLQGKAIWIRKIQFMGDFYDSKFESSKTKRIVLNRWDKYGLARLYFWGSKIKSIILWFQSLPTSEVKPELSERSKTSMIELIRSGKRLYHKEKKILAVIVSYRPNEELLCRNIKAFINDVDKVLIWENSQESEKLQYRFIQNEKVEYCGDGVNSISRALNYAWKYASENGYDYLLTMDQDSVWDDFHGFLNETVYNPSAPKGIWGPNAYYNYFIEVAACDYIITSGMLLPIEMVNYIGGWDENFEIDGLDDEFCLRAKQKGVQAYYWGACRLNQRYGNPERAKLFGKALNVELRNYSPSRLYSIYKNHILLIRKFPEERSLKYDFKHVWLPNIFLIAMFEKHRIKKLFSICKGIIDGFYTQLKF